MSDPLSITASAAGLVSLGLTVCSGLVEYYSAWKDQHSDISTMCESCESLYRTFELLEEKVRHPLLDRKSVDRVTESIISCAAGVQGLRSKLDKIRGAKAGILYFNTLNLFVWFHPIAWSWYGVALNLSRIISHPHDVHRFSFLHFFHHELSVSNRI